MPPHRTSAPAQAGPRLALVGRDFNGLNAMSAFATYLTGFIILIIGLAFAAYLLNVPTTWILVGVIVLIGLGVLTATSRTKHKDPPPPPGPPTPPGTPPGTYR